VFWLVALAFSAFHGRKAVQIFVNEDVRKARKDDWAWHLHQFWLKLLRSVVGWAALWLLLPALEDCFITECPSDVAHYVGWFISFVGVTGYLPMTLIGIASSFDQLIDAIVARIK